MRWLVSKRRTWRLSTQILVFQALLLAVTSAIGLALVIRGVQRSLDREAELRALAVARSVAATPEIGAAVSARDRSGIVERRAEAIRRATGSSFVVVTDDRGIRYSHPNRRLLGQRVSTSPSGALHGATVLAVQTGTLGRSARAKVPLRAANGRIVGEVSVGFLETKLQHTVNSFLPEIFGYWALLLAVGLLGALLFAARLKRQTLGLELATIADLFREREAVLRHIREGVLAVDEAGRMRVINEEAERLLGLTGDSIGQPIDDLPVHPRLIALIRDPSDQADVVLVQNRHVLVANCRPIRIHGRELGAVVTVRDRTELERLSRELGGVRSVTETLRAQTHEFSNRLHVISGLLQLRHHEEALSYVEEINRADEVFSRSVDLRVAHPLLRALLVAKAAVAAEHGVELRIDQGTFVGSMLTDPDTVLTVLGNLIDNALDAAPHGSSQPPWVEVKLDATDDALRIEVSDSGPGVPEADREAVFTVGHTTKPRNEVGGRGVGLALVHRVVEEQGGQVTVRAHTAGGAVFEASIPGVGHEFTEVTA